MAEDPALLAALLNASGAGGTPGGALGGASGTPPLGSLPVSLGGYAPNAVGLQQANPAMPWYMVPGIFAPGQSLPGTPGFQRPPPGALPQAPVATAPLVDPALGSGGGGGGPG